MIYDVLIIGAGVIGGMAARELSRYRLKICLLEKEQDVAMGASRANSGIIHGGYDPEPGTLKAQLNTQGIDLLYQAAQELHVPHRNNGSLVCAFSEQEDQTLEELLRRGHENGIFDLEILTGDQVRALEPHLSGQITGALHIPRAGIICPYELTLAAVGNAMDNGVTLRRGFGVAKIEKTDGIFTVTASGGETVRGRYVLNCAGGYTDAVASLVGDDFYRIIPRSGEYMLLDKEEGDRVSRTIFQVPSAEGKGILVSPTADGNLLTGPTAARVDTPDSRDTTPEGLAQVRSLAAKSVPSVRFDRVITSFTGVRSSEEGGDFILQESTKVPGFIHAAAIDSPGLTCCVAIARYLAQLLAKAGLALEVREDFDPIRPDPHAFRHMTEEEQDAYIRTHPAYGRIVCRCETVSEGEILDAIHRNPGARDVDGVKRRTRSGMGRCQGGFCSGHVMALLSRELGIPMEQVTKSGGGSYLLTGRLGQ